MPKWWPRANARQLMLACQHPAPRPGPGDTLILAGPGKIFVVTCEHDRALVGPGGTSGDDYHHYRCSWQLAVGAIGDWAIGDWQLVIGDR